MQRADRHHDCRLQGGGRDPPRGDDEGGVLRQRGRGAQALGVEGSIGAGFGELTASPHGSIKPRTLREGDIVLMDGGCKVDGYSSDISRTVVFGKPDPAAEGRLGTREARAGGGVRRGEARRSLRGRRRGGAQGDHRCRVRARATRCPACRTAPGHGIGLDGHEQINLVRGNTTPLAAGMCFSNEPMIAIPGEFGVRLEDCMYITEEGAKFFSQPSPSIDQPCA